MICHVCQQPQPGPNRFSCSPHLRDAARRRTLAARAEKKRRGRMAYLLKGAKPWDEAPTQGAMLARLDAFCARYSETLDNESDLMQAVATPAVVSGLRSKATKVREPFPPKRRRSA